MTKEYGLIGYPLTHSFSQDFFNRKFATEGIDAVYTPFPITSIAVFTELLTTHQALCGLNVTIPYKEAVIPYLDEIDEVAAIAGAVNCITISNGKTKGYNTDIIGFEQSLGPMLKPQHNKALVLGTGGASKAVTFVLNKLGIAYLSVSRQKTEHAISYDEVTPEIITEHKLIIDTTPLGMFPEIDALPALPYATMGTDHLLYDLVYNPPETKFLLAGKLAGATIKNGLEMLHLQALAAWQLWSEQ